MSRREARSRRKARLRRQSPDHDIVVLADDLTGAMDSGLQFRIRGFSTAVALGTENLPTKEVIVLNSDTRACSASQARARTMTLAAQLKDTLLYKKVDSTMRGNVGYELRALYESLGVQAFLFAPAFPQEGRTTIWGEQRVHGLPLDQSAFAQDPRWPMHEAHIPTLLMQQSGLGVAQIDLAQIERGTEALAKTLRACSQPIIVLDATTQEHLRCIAGAAAILGRRWVPCGSAGLAEAWAESLAPSHPKLAAGPLASNRRTLTVAASRSDRTLAQLALLCSETETKRVTLRSQNWYRPEQEIARLYNACRTALQSNAALLLEASTAPLIPGQGQRIADMLAAVTAHLVKEAPCTLAGLTVTGGDMALAVCRVLRAEAIEIVQAIQPGIPGGRLLGGNGSGLWIVTKAGGFGDDKALLEAQTWLLGQNRD